MDCIPDVDYAEACVEEIALEGLDGITASALWVRLSQRPNFKMTLDDAARSYLWETVVHHADIDFYLLPEPRPPLVIHNRFDNIDMETGLVLATQDDMTNDDIYPYVLVTEPGVFGSCATFHQRERVTDEVRPNQVRFMSLSESQKTWGESLVLVASTERRRRTLMGPETNPNLQLTPVQYAILERIGRSRYLGEVSLGQSVIHSNAKTLFYHRKVLLANNLIEKQVHHHYLKRGNNSLLRNGMLFHITRFYVERKSKIYLLYQELVKHLLTKPDRSDAVKDVLALLGIHQKSLKKAFQKGLKKFAEIRQEPYRERYPNSLPYQWFYINKTEKMVSVIHLLDGIDQDSVQRILSEDADAAGEANKSGNKGGGGGENEDDDDDDENDTDCQANAISMGLPISVKTYGIPDQSRHVLDRSVLHQAYDAFLQAGTAGLSERSLSTVLGVPHLEGRSVCRKLLRINAVTAIMKDRGRQKYKNYSAKCFLGTSEHCKEIIDECQKLLEFASDAQTKREEEEATASTEDPFPLTSTVGVPEIPSTFLDDVRKMSESGNSNSLANSGLVTSRAMKRANLIVKVVREAKLFDSPFMLQKVITVEEANEGYRIDRKSLARLINRLNAAGLIKSVKSVLTYGEHEKKVHFICDPSLKSTDPLVYSALENAKLKYFSRYRAEQQTQDKLAQLDPISKSSAQLRILNVTRRKRPEFVPVNGRIYGFEPKFVRMKLFHQYMFYLVYDYDGQLIKPKDADYPIELREFTDQTKLTSMPPVYHAENSWRRFLPQLPQHTGWSRGWCLFSDILLRMPLSLLVKLLNVNFKVEGLREYLDHPILRNVPITHLPVNLRTSVLYARRYVFRLYDIASQLGYIGILSFNQPHKEKDQAFFYLHRNARILDTTISKPGYVKITPDIDYPVHMHTLNSSVDVTVFWETLESICLRTPLGSHPKVPHEMVTFDIDIDKKPGMAAMLVSKTDMDIVDDGTQPGDGAGAGGLDSAFFAHLKRNWSWVSIANEIKQPRIAKKAQPVKRTAMVEAKRQPSLIAKFLRAEAETPFPPNPRKRLTRLAINNQLLSLTAPKSTPAVSYPTKPIEPVKIFPPRKKRTKSRTRQYKQRLKRLRKPYYDDKDIAALKLMTKIRGTWSSKEDSLLLLTKVACFLLDAEAGKRRTVVSFGVVRDFLHKQVEDSKSKTSRACQRRARYMMLNPETAFNVSVFVGESQDDPVIREICDRPYVAITNETEWRARFDSLMEHLLVKFKASASTNKPESFELPDTLEQLEAQYKIVLSQEFLTKKHSFFDVKNVVDIYFGIVYSLILSSVGSSKDGNNWNNVLYQIYQQYPESLLRSVLAKLRSQFIVSRRKDVTRRMPKKTSLCLVTFPYQLSITYRNLFLSAYRENVFVDACKLQSLLVHDLDTSGTGVDIGSGCSLGYAALIVSLMHGKLAHFKVEIPDNMIVLNVDDPRINERGRQFLQKFCAWEAQRLSENQSSSIAGDNDQSALPPLAKKARLDESQMIAGTASTTDVSYEPTNMQIDGDINAEAKETLMKMSSSSRFALYLLRTQLNEKVLSDTQHSQDYLSVNACQVDCKLQSHPMVMSESGISNILEKLTKFVPESKTTVEDLAQMYKSAGFDDSAVREMRNLHIFLQEKREVGAKWTELNEKFGSRFKTLDLKHHLQLMEENQLLLKVGLSCIRYVTIARAKPWLLHSFKPTKKSDPMAISSTDLSTPVEIKTTDLSPSVAATSTDTTTSTTLPTTTESNPNETGNRPHSTRKKFPNIRYMEPKNPEYIRHLRPIQFICRPWRRPDGELNRPILNEMLRSILSHVMCFPAVTHATICEKYASVLSPVQLLELLEMLQDAGCIRRSFVRQCKTQCLFDPPTKAVILDRDEYGAVVHYHPEVDCILKLGRFLFF